MCVGGGRRRVEGGGAGSYLDLRHGVSTRRNYLKFKTRTTLTLKRVTEYDNGPASFRRGTRD